MRNPTNHATEVTNVSLITIWESRKIPPVHLASAVRTLRKDINCAPHDSKSAHYKQRIFYQMIGGGHDP